MFKHHICLHDELTEVVEIYTVDGDLIAKGEMTIQPNKSPVIEAINPRNIGNLKESTFRVCTHSGVWYTLLECAVYDHGRIYPKVIIKSDSHDGVFKTVKFVIRGLSQWFDNSKFTDAGDDHVTKYLNTNTLSTEIKDDDLGGISISSENWWQTNSKKGGIFTISEYTVISLEAVSASFSCVSAINYIHRIRNLLSILIGYPLVIDYCFNIEDKRKTSIYFVAFQEDEQAFENKQACLVPSRYLFSEGVWANILKNALETNRDNFLTIWSRLPGLSGFSKYWEYELLACVSLTDRYAAVFSSTSDEKITNGQYRKLKRCLKSAVKDFAKDIGEGKINAVVIDSIIEQVNAIKNTSLPSFQSCFEHAYNSMSDDFRVIIDLSDDDFNHLKKLRNQIAHGDDPDTKLDGFITHEIILQNKLLVILYCWALRDFGIAESDCIKFLSNWLHPIIRAADLNKTELDKATGHYNFLPLNKKDFNDIAKLKFGAITLEHTGNGKNYRYRKDLQQVMNNWISDRSADRPRNLEKYLTLHVDTDRIQSLCYVNSIYVENGSQSHCTGGVCILNPPRELIDENRFWKYDPEINTWCQPLKDDQ